MADKLKLKDAERPARGETAPRTSRAKSSRAGAGSSARGGESSGAAAAPPRPSLRGDDKKLRDALVGMYAQVGAFMSMGGAMRKDLGLSTAGANVVAQSEMVADAWMDLAQSNPRVKQTLQGLVTGGSVAALVGVHASMVIPVLASRGAVPAEVGNMFLHPDAKEHSANLAAMWNAEAQAAAAAQNGGSAPA